MSVVKRREPGVSVIARYRAQWTMIIAFAWTIVDVLWWVGYMRQPYEQRMDTVFQFLTTPAVAMRIIIVFLISLLTGYLLIFRLRGMFRDYPLIVNLVFKTVILILASFIMNFLLHTCYSLFILHLSPLQSYINFIGESTYTSWLWEKIKDWVLVFIVTQLVLELNEKYSPGVFVAILVGKYIKPRIENRIIMFLDLKDSTPIAEQLGHTQYFRFIRDFIYNVSVAMLEYDGRIYQYVGDEVVVTWPYSDKNALNCINAVISARRQIQKRSEEYRRMYRVIPEFKVGIHVGDVTVGEIGLIKKDLAISGDTMNTASRIRSACNDLNQKFIASKDFVDHLDMEDWQAEPLGFIDLKGKSNGIELFALKI